MEVIGAVMILCMVRFSRAQPINVLMAGSDGITALGLQFQQWSEQNKNRVVPHYGSYGRERAILETEGIVSKLDSTYTQSHQLIANIVGHRPLLDMTQEYEKYGNDGEGIRKVGTAIINGFDSAAHVVNAVLDAPSDKVRYLSKQTTSFLNGVGAKLNGL